MQEAKIQKADVRARQMAYWLTAAALVLAGVLVLVLDDVQEVMQAWIAARLEEPGGVEAALLAFSILAILPLIAAGIYLFVLGARGVRARRFPPPGQAMLRDTPVLKGAAGQRRSRLQQVLALILIVLALLVPVAMAYVARSLAALG